jgi:DNA polymerase III gamma/tau subunit
MDEKTVKSIVKAMVGSEVARLHSIIMEEINEVKAKVEELSRRGVDVETIRQVIGEIQSKLLDSVKQIIDQRVMHLAQIIEEKSNDVKDVLDLVNELLKAETKFEEELAKLRAEIRRLLDEEALEELLYRALVKHGVIRRRRRKWAPLIAGLGILAAIIAGLIINPIITLVVLFIVIVVLLRW